jgi:KaiC/GvpD/RAD55 family RecA-like ATPase
MTSPVSADRRYTRGRRCPICGGAENAPRGAERRCTGFLSDDGDYAHCSREEHAGEIKLSGSGTTYGHRLRGPCKCGAQHGEAPTDAAPRAHCREAATYDYLDEAGAFLYQVVRYEPKDFRQRRRDPAAPERWIYKLDGVRRVLYRLDRVLAADRARVVYVVEGEKDVHSLEQIGLTATCNPGGAGKWHTVDDCACKALAERHVVVIADRDEPGRKHAADVMVRLQRVAASVRVIEPAHGKDVTDWIAAGATMGHIETAPTSDMQPGAAGPPDVDIEITRTAVAPTPRTPKWHRAADIIETIQRYAAEPWVSLRLGLDLSDDAEIVAVRAGGIVVVMGPTGAGKSSLVAGMLIAHARDRGPVVVLSRELPMDEFGARMIGMQCDASWPDVLKGRVQLSEMERALSPRVFVLDRKNATLEALAEVIEAAQAEYPGESVLVAVDYLQILESGEHDTRAKVADVVSKIDEIARRYRAVVLAISQMSRASSRAARNGEAIGADSTDGGAESAAIERAATVTLSIGSSGPEREDGTRAVDLSIGKGRMTGGDRVLPMSYCGRSGRWRLTGEARPAAEVKAEREGQRDNAKQHAAELTIMVAAKRATEPQAREDLSAVACCGKGIRRAAVAALLLRGELVEVARKNPRSRAWKVWTKAQADAAGIPLAGGAS